MPRRSTFEGRAGGKRCPPLFSHFYRHIFDVPLDFGVHVSVTGVTDPYGFLPEFSGFGQYGVQMPRNCMETRMSEQFTGFAPTLPPTIKRPSQPGKPKADILRKLLSRKQGATVVQIEKQLGWQPHTVWLAATYCLAGSHILFAPRSHD